jgi:hypothetical protein
MKVIASIEYEKSWATGLKDNQTITVRKCPPNYKPQEWEHVVELEDYTDDDIKNYISKEDLTAWKEEHDVK